jgi:hypothetical protein
MSSCGSRDAGVKDGTCFSAAVAAKSNLWAACSAAGFPT